MISSTMLRSMTPGINPAPIPWILCGPGAPPERTGESAGSTAISLTFGLCSLSPLPVPVAVPPVPTADTNASTFPSVSLQISSAVVFLWIAGFALFSNCCGMNALPYCSLSSFALAMAPFIPSLPGVNTISAPRADTIFLRSTLMVSGMVSIR